MTKTVKERKATIFLLTLLIIITLFVAIVCIFISSRNKKLEVGLTEPPKTTAQSSTAESTTLPPDSSALQTTETEETTAKKAEETEGQAVTAASKNNSSSYKTVSVDTKNPYLTLVNFNNRLTSTYKPQNLTTVAGSTVKLDSTVATHFEEMYNAALSEGIKLTPYSGYCSYELQKQNYENKLAYYKSMGYTDEEAASKTALSVSPAGASEHNLGFAIDIVCKEERFKNTDEYKWLTEHAHEYGFILRYPENKTEITGVEYEPWHWRYVGTDVAEKLKNSEQCLEEYIGG